MVWRTLLESSAGSPSSQFERIVVSVFRLLYSIPWESNGASLVPLVPRDSQYLVGTDVIKPGDFC